jgi:hypothetical protein
MPRSRVAMLSWVVAIAFILASALVLVDRLNLYATPPDLQNANMVERALGSAAYRQAIWPVFMWTYLLFAIGFTASVAFAWAVAARAGVSGGLPLFAALATTGGIVAAIASIIPVGSVESAVWQLYCDCGFKETEIIAGQWAGYVAQDIANWLDRFGSVVIAMALIALIRDARAVISPSLRTWTWVTAIALIAWPLLGIVQLFDGAVEDWLTLIVGAVLVPVWAVWLGRSVDAVGRTFASSA